MFEDVSKCIRVLVISEMLQKGPLVLYNITVIRDLWYAFDSRTTNVGHYFSLSFVPVYHNDSYI